MQYNIHPIFVHFPIAFLMLYSIIKILPFNKWLPKIAWKQVELVLLVPGVIGAFVASSTGEMAEHLVNPPRQLVEAHSTFAGIATWAYVLILVGELLFIFVPKILNKFNTSNLTKFLILIQKLLTNKKISILLVVVGLVSITITGLLGGVIVYGATADPFAKIILNILGITL